MRASLLRVVHGAGLADHRDPDLARVLELLLDPARDLGGEPLGPRVVDLGVLDHDPYLAAGLDRVALLDAGEAVGDLLQLLEALDVDLEALAPRPGPGA